MAKAPKRPSIVAKTEDGSPMVEVFSMKTEGNVLVMDVKALDSMRMNVLISTDDIAKGLCIVDKKEVMAFAKQLPAAIRKNKKLKKAEAQADQAAK